MFSSLKVRNFRLYWLGMFLSLIGTWIQTVAQSWLVFELTHSAFLLGLVGFLGMIPVFVLSLLGGVVADKMNKRKIILLTQYAFMFLAFVLAILTQLKLITPVQIMLIALLNGVVMAFDAPSRQAIVAELVGKQNLLNAIALNSAAFNSARIIGPALAGILIAAIGMSGCFYLNAVSFIAAISALLLIKLEVGFKKQDNSHWKKDLREGLSFIRRNPDIRTLISMTAVTSLFGVSYVVLMPIFANEVLKVGVKGLGILMSVAGAGALVAALILAAAGDFKRKGRLLITSSIIFSFSLSAFSLSKIYWLSLFSLACVGWASVTAMSLINNLLQARVPDEFRGRVMSAFMFTFAGILPFGNLLAGAMAHFWGVSLTVFSGGVICAAYFIIINILCPKIREL